MLSQMVVDSGLPVRGEVLNLPLHLGNHAQGCGSCGYEVFKKLGAEPGVIAVEVFVPVHDQLRLLTKPGTLTSETVAMRLSALSPEPPNQ